MGNKFLEHHVAGAASTVVVVIGELVYDEVYLVVVMVVKVMIVLAILTHALNEVVARAPHIRLHLLHP